MRPSQYAMVALDEACATIRHLTPRLGVEGVALTAALGRTLAEDILAAESLPPIATSAVDGYALIAAAGAARRRVLAEITAGHPSAKPLASDAAVRIMTGAPLPPSADAVLMVEQGTEDAGWVSPARAVSPGENVIPVGLDVVGGQRVLSQGTIIGPAEIALLASIGLGQARVHRRPRVAVLSTGDELVEPGERIGDGKIRDSNRYGLMAAVTAAGGQPMSLGIVRDDAVEQARRIRHGLAIAEMVITSGGVSVGSRDLIKPIFERLGQVHFGRVAIKPGKPVTFATVGEKLAFGLPGFPVSSLVSFELFVRPALLMMQGRRDVTRPTVDVMLEDEATRTADRVEFQRALVRAVGGRLWARTKGSQASSRLLSLVGANALLRIDAGEGVVSAGTVVPALLLDAPMG